MPAEFADAAQLAEGRLPIADPHGQSVSLTWDAQYRLVAITDAIGQVSSLEYADPDPLRITAVVDPFGRRATFTYNGYGQLESITDVIGIVSRMTYGSSDMVSALTTPYGTTSFRYEFRDKYVNRFIEATDPLGGTERVEFWWQTDLIEPTAPAAEVPTGFEVGNSFMHWTNSVYWDKVAWQRAPGDLAAARITKWSWKEELPYRPAFATSVVHSLKRPLENRIWYRYPGQSDPALAGTLARPSRVGRVLDDGTSQVSETTYNGQGSVVTQVDPLGRRTTYAYDVNGTDLLETRQTTGSLNDLLSTAGGYVNHQPQTVTDAAGQTTSLTYNAAGQPLTITNAKGETSTFGYETGTGRLLTMTGALPGSTTTYTYDVYGRVRTTTGPDGFTTTTDYDAWDRPVRVTYPDQTYEETTYERLDAVARRDRAGRTTRTFYDALRRVVGTRDPAGRTIQQVWCPCGALDAMVDAKGQRTRWERDLQGRVTREVRQDESATVFAYEATTSRLKRKTDAKGQHTDYQYYLDDQLQQTSYPNAVIPTASVAYTYDAGYGRLATMVDGTGTTGTSYHPVGGLGGGQVASVDGPLANDTITHGYDALGRVVSRAIDGSANPVTWSFDAQGRVTQETNLLGSFIYGYDGVTPRVVTVTYPNGQTSAYSYLPAAQDHRLQTIHHRYPNASTMSKFDYTYDVVGNIMTWRQQADTAAVVWKYGYDAADQVTLAVKESTDPTPVVLARYGYAYDAAGNRTAEQIDDAVTGASYDRMNRLTSQQPGGLLRFAGSVSEPATVTIGGRPATVAPDNRFAGQAAVTAGTNSVTIRHRPQRQPGRRSLRGAPDGGQQGVHLRREWQHDVRRDANVRVRCAESTGGGDGRHAPE